MVCSTAVNSNDISSNRKWTLRDRQRKKERERERTVILEDELSLTNLAILTLVPVFFTYGGPGDRCVSLPKYSTDVTCLRFHGLKKREKERERERDGTR